MDVVFDPAPNGLRETLFVMLPGAHFHPSDLIDRGFTAGLRTRLPMVDMLICDARVDHYVGGEVVARLDEAIGQLEVSHHYTELWLLGISLGGSGALHFARAYPGRVKGIVLLAPFLGTRGLIAEVHRSGGLAHWTPPALTDDETSLIGWLKALSNPPHDDQPVMFLGYGLSDRFAPASRMLAERLPIEQVKALPGDHDWTTWLQLWHALLPELPLEVEA